MTPREQVLSALASAKENGYAEELLSMTDEGIAIDLLDCDADLEGNSIESILPFIKEWRDKQ